jgi:hypothetical protein
MALLTFATSSRISPTAGWTSLIKSRSSFDKDSIRSPCWRSSVRTASCLLERRCIHQKHKGQQAAPKTVSQSSRVVMQNYRGMGSNGNRHVSALWGSSRQHRRVLGCGLAVRQFGAAVAATVAGRLPLSRQNCALMRPPESKIIARERIKLGRVVYHARVFASEDDFHGEWTCTACRQVGQSVIGLGSESHAMAWARGGLEVHHAILHEGDNDDGCE